MILLDIKKPEVNTQKRSMDSIQLRGNVSIYQEDDEGNREYIINDTRNHFVNAMLKGLTSFFAGYASASSTSCWSYDAYILLGLDTVTPTSFDMAALFMPIGSGSGTAPNLNNGNGVSTDGDGNYTMNVFSTWNAGTVNGRVGELGLYLRPFTVLTPAWNAAHNATQAMCSRLAVADGAFEPFTIDTSRSLTVKWEVNLGYV